MVRTPWACIVIFVRDVSEHATTTCLAFKDVERAALQLHYMIYCK